MNRKDIIRLKQSLFGNPDDPSDEGAVPEMKESIEPYLTAPTEDNIIESMSAVDL